MPADPHPLGYATPARPVRSARTVWRIVLAASLGGLLAVFILATLLGDVDDDWWKFFLAGSVPSTIVAFATRHRHVHRRPAAWTAILFFVIGGAIDVGAVVSLVLSRNIITGEALVEMDGLLPFVWMIASLVPLLIGVFALLLAKPRGAL